MKRDTAQIIFRTVVFAGAMLGAPACSKKQPQTTPTNTTTEPAKPGDTTEAKKPDGQAPDPSADPCAGDGRIRGTDEDGGGGAGRGFILS
jgi:hypothetical protein